MATTVDAPGVIEPGHLYTVAEARERLRAGNTTWQRIRERGLRITRIGGKSYVLGDDLIRLFAEAREVSPA
jgi:hypothetical protein